MSTPSFQTLRLARGKHSSPRHGACVMELASLLAGEDFSDRPKSVSPVLAAFLRGYNDLLDDRQRQDLIAYAAEALGTVGSAALERARVERLIEWAVQRWGGCAQPRGSGGFGQPAARPLSSTDPDSAAIYAIRSIHNNDRCLHEQVLALLDELIGMGGPRPALVPCDEHTPRYDESAPRCDERAATTNARPWPPERSDERRLGPRPARCEPAGARQSQPDRRPTAPRP